MIRSKAGSLGEVVRSIVVEAWPAEEDGVEEE